MKMILGDILQTTPPAVGSAHRKCVKGTNVLKGDTTMRKVYFTRVEADGKEYIYINYRRIRGMIIFNKNGKCCKYELKKRATNNDNS